MEGDQQQLRFTTAVEKLDISMIVPETVLSPEELRLLKHKFSLCNTSSDNQKMRAPLARLTAARARKLFQEDYPSLSEWETQAVFQKYDVDGDGRLSFKEYLQTRAYYRMLLEESTELELLRIFSILDTDADGILLAHDVLHRIERTGLQSVSILKQVLTQAAEATKVAEKSSQYYHREGEITFDHFLATIRDVNRKMEQGIAAKTLRVIDLQQQLHQHQQLRLQVSSSAPDHKAAALQIEIDVLLRETRRMKKELITDSKNALGEACETLMATYENEQHVYECLNNLINYCSLRDATLFRHNLEREGKKVNILNSMLLSPPEHLKQRAEYRRMTNLSLNHKSLFHKTVNATLLDPVGSPRQEAVKTTRASTPLHTTEAMLETLLMNPTLRKQFAYYAMAGNVTNLVCITLTNFIKFVKDCKLDLLPTPALRDVDVSNIFAATAGTNKAMNFVQWLSACILIFKRFQPLQDTFSDTDVQKLVDMYMISRAKTIHVQQLAPDISQNHVMKLLKEHIWQLKQIFSHFGVQSLVEVDSSVRLDMKEFLTFARAFNIIRSPTERDGEPYTPPYMPASSSIAPISLVELIREYYAAKLDISITNPGRREAADLNFREFLRCVQRIALAMHVRNAKLRDNTAPSTIFEATKDDGRRSPEKLCIPRTVGSPRYQRRGNLLAASPTKTCKMTTTSVISRLLQTSRAILSHQLPIPNEAPQVRGKAAISHLASGWIEDDTTSVCPNIAPKSVAQHNPTRPAWSKKARRRPLSSGGPPVIRIIQQPTI